MAVTNLNRPLLHRKEWQMMTPAPTATAAGAFIVHDVASLDNLALLMSSATVHYLYRHNEDAWIQIPSGALTGTFGAGSCGAAARWSRTVTANGGSTTTATTAGAITGIAIGRTIRFLTGTAANIGLERTITGVIINPGGTSTIQWSSALPAVVASTDTFAINTGRFFVVNAGTFALGSIKEFDPLTLTWGSNLSITGLPATWGTDGRLISTPSHVTYASGTATAGGASTLTNSAKTWTANQWTSYQVRITGGTGSGQIRTIASNTGTALTTSTAWTTTPDATSTYVIEGNDDFLYLMGNNAVTLYRYSISGNTWTTLAPGVARAGAPVAGTVAAWVQDSDDANWANESDIKDGRYIFSFRGGGTALDRYDIALNTWLADTSYGPIAETFASGSASAALGRYMFLRKDATNRFFKLSTRGNYVGALSTNLYPDGAAVIGDKLWVKLLDSTSGIAWLYSLANTGTVVHRLMLV